MNLRHIVRLALAAPAVATLVACGGGSGNAISDADAVSAEAACPATVGNLTVTDIGLSQCQIGGTLTEAGTLSSNVTWFLDGRLQVGDDASISTLTIDPGTQIRGGISGGAPDYVLVFPGSALRANGTSSDPVQFLSDDTGVDGSAEWGGVFLRGFNGSDVLAGGTAQGANDLDYVVVAEAGAPVAVSLNGEAAVTYQDNIVVNGVDSSTTFTFVQSHNSARDGFHILNGDPRMSWLLATGSGRDGVWYSDFTGLIKDLMVIHNRDTDGSTGRAGIYASETTLGNSNPRIVNATLVGRDSTSEDGNGDIADNEVGIIFSDNTDKIRLANVLIANFRNGCYEANTFADLTDIDTSIPGPTYLDGVHCSNEAGNNGAFGIVRGDATGFPVGTVGVNNINGDGLVYYGGLGPEIMGAGNSGTFNPAAGGINFTGEIQDRSGFFTAGWYLNNLRGLGNGLIGNAAFLNGFLDGNTNMNGDATATPPIAVNTVVDAADANSPFIINGATAFNQDVAEDTFGYDMTHVGAVRGGAITNVQFDGWTVATGVGEGFAVVQVP
ncbi:MAG: hypothetical protein COB94_000855 [Gammaproteobacteria bacterium]|nr:hypothetical protein [Gammaproteobacteria bacterium]